MKTTTRWVKFGWGAWFGTSIKFQKAWRFVKVLELKHQDDEILQNVMYYKQCHHIDKYVYTYKVIIDSKVRTLIDIFCAITIYIHVLTKFTQAQNPGQQFRWAWWCNTVPAAPWRVPFALMGPSPSLDFRSPMSMAGKRTTTIEQNLISKNMILRMLV